MQQDCTILLEGNAISEGGILWMCFDAFSSKNGYETTFTNDYGQGCFIVFECRSFTGKERDEETGYGYFGARYMDHELMTMWLSVDPLADKYPNISPYHYCHWSPIVVVDSWGESDRKFTDYETGEYLGEIDDGVDETVRITQEDFVTLQKLYKIDENRGDEKHTNYNEMIEMYSIGKVGYDIAQTAKKYEGSTAWAYNTKKDKFGKDTHKCNQFVDDVLLVMRYFYILFCNLLYICYL